MIPGLMAADLTDKLDPARFPGMSPLMAAVVGYVLDEEFTQPTIAELAVSEQENLVYIRQDGATGYDDIQSLEDLRNNWNRLLDAAGLTDEERQEAVNLFNRKVLKVPGTVEWMLASLNFRRRQSRHSRYCSNANQRYRGELWFKHPKNKYLLLTDAEKLLVHYQTYDLR